MADIAQAMLYKIDVKNGLVKQPMAGMLMRGDKNANRIIAELVDGDKIVSLDGVTVTGKFFRGGDGIEIPLEGAASGNEASVLLNEHCYAVDGYFEASVKLTTGGATRTILTITGHVESDGEGGILDIENVVPSVADIVAQYQRMQEVTAQTEAATKAANDAAANANTETGKAITAANNANNQAEAAKRAAEAANAAAKNWGNSTAANSAKLGGKAPEYYIQPINLLDNSDFRNPVNQRGSTSYSGAVYTIDRWRTWIADDSVAVNDGYITVTGNGIHQYFRADIFNDAIYTVAAKKTDGTIVVYARNAKDDYVENGNLGFGYETSNGNVTVKLFQGSYVWAALYEGSYTAETLPPYVPKGYAQELAECQRYALPFNDAGSVGFSGYLHSDSVTARIFIPTPIRIRSDAVPSISVYDITALRVYPWNAKVASISVSNVTNSGVLVNAVLEASQSSGNTPCVLKLNTPFGIYNDL